MDEARRTTDRVSRFLQWCAGADPRLLDELPRSEAVRQAGFGTLVLVPAVLAFIAMSYALSTLTDRAPVYLAAGAAWSLVVFAFDRFVVSTFRKSGDVLDDVTSMVFVVRLVFALFVGVIVAHPLVLLCFEETIDRRIAADERVERQRIAAARAEARAAIEGQIAALEAAVAAKERQRNDYQATLNREIDGIVTGRTTGIPGRGASAREKERQLLQIEGELAAERRRSGRRRAVLEARIERLRIEDERRAVDYDAARDYLARATTLGVLAAESPHVRRVQWFLILFFVFVDSLPVVFKGFSPRSAYDVAVVELERRAARSFEADGAALATGRPVAAASPPGV